MTVRAKFRVSSITRSKYGAEEQQTIHLQPVTGHGDASEENKAFWKYTPSGRIELSTINPDAGNAFALDQEFYVDFTPA
jgi:hypothetical protein